MADVVRAIWNWIRDWDRLNVMPDLVQIDWKALATEANVRALLEDFIQPYRGIHATHRLALVVWFGKSPQSREHNLLALFTGFPMNEIAVESPQPLVWKTNLEDGPFVRIHWTSVDHFAQLVKDPVLVRKYVENAEVLTFDKTSLPQEILPVFGVVTEPSGLIKGWYLSADQYVKSQTVRNSL